MLRRPRGLPLRITRSRATYLHYPYLSHYRLHLTYHTDAGVRWGAGCKRYPPWAGPSRRPWSVTGPSTYPGDTSPWILVREVVGEACRKCLIVRRVRWPFGLLSLSSMEEETLADCEVK